VKLASKVNGLVVGIVLFVAVMVAIFSVNREYQIALDRLTNEFSVRVLSQSDLHVGIYLRDERRLTAVIEDLLSSAGVAYASILDTSGQPILRLGQTDGGLVREPPISTLYRVVPPSGVGRVSLSEDGERVRDNWVSAIFTSDSLTHMTIPIFSALDPQGQTLSPGEIGEIMALAGNANQRFVMGYVHVAISTPGLASEMLPRLTITILVSGLLVLFCAAALSYLVRRRITAALSQVVETAEQVAADWLDEPVDFYSAGQIDGITTVLEGVTQSLVKYRACVDSVNEQLGMSIGGETSQPDRRSITLDDTVREIVKTRERLQQTAYYDSLTSLPNRRLFCTQLDQFLHLAERSGQQLALLFLDIDNFKRINDSLGHTAGDLLLKEIALRIERCVRESDVVAHAAGSDKLAEVSRLGGDEFTVVLNQVEIAESASQVAQRIIDAVKEPVHIEGHELEISCSIGIAMAPGDASNTKDLLKAADTAMYHAKGRGKNNFAYYQDHMAAPALDQLRLERDLREAVKRDELTLNYQPQIDSRTGCVVGAEALLRWSHPKHGVIPPLKFIPLAEEMGLIDELGKWTLEEVCRQLIQFNTGRLKLPKITVNISALQFNQEFISTVKAVLEESGTEPSCLQLELTEGAILEDVSASVRTFTELKALGVSLSIDNFGTGSSSLKYLSSLPLDELKIDRSFVMKSQLSEEDANLTVVMIGIARSMQLELVAEGVENRKQYRFLRRQGAHIMQGYLFSAPVTAEELRTLLVPGYFKEQLGRIAET
jgi:diguanylate cyclase (GGDEF)-like protein